MQRVGMLLRVDPPKLDEYRRLHAQVWPELLTELTAAGMRNYSLWLHPSGLEFGYLECDDWQAVCDYLSKSAVHDRWQEFMRDYLLTDPDDSAGGQPVTLLEQVFMLQ